MQGQSLALVQYLEDFEVAKMRVKEKEKLVEKQLVELGYKQNRAVCKYAARNDDNKENKEHRDNKTKKAKIQ